LPLNAQTERRRSSISLSDQHIDVDGDLHDDDDHHHHHTSTDMQLRDRFPHASHASTVAVEVTTMSAAPPYHHHASDADLIGTPPR
jgi:hypothetical protein